jgi:ATP-dependent DNA ligase
VLPRNLRPIPLSRRSEPFDSDDFLFELKVDGFRALAHIKEGVENWFRGTETRFVLSPRLPNG